MNIVGLLTGRGNNTLKDKNILDVLGHPVLYYPATAGINSRYIDRFYCSSDDEKILQIAETIGYRRIKRPDALATPTSKHVDVLLHALGVMKDEGYVPDLLICFLANNVTVKAKWVDDCIKSMLEDPTLSAVVPVYVDNDHHPLRAKRLNAEGFLEMYEKGVDGPISTNRQDLPPCYFLSHNFWVLRARSIYEHESGQQPWGFMGMKIKPYVIDQSIDIHDTIDLLIAREWIKNNLK